MSGELLRQVLIGARFSTAETVPKLKLDLDSSENSDEWLNF
jgi:hypothetical protein